MQTVVFVDNEPELISHLGKNPTIGPQPRFFSYVRLGMAGTEALTSGGFQKVPKPLVDAPTKNGFIQAYSNLIAEFAARFPRDRAWWATDVASKNRFSSRLPMALEQFLLMEKVLSRPDFSTLIVIGQYWETIEAIKHHRANKGLKIIYAGNMNKHKGDLKVARRRQFFAAVYNAGKILKRRHLCRKQLGAKIEKALAKASYDCVLKTFIYDHCFKEKGRYKEVFFGQLPEYLGKDQNILIFANIIGDFGRCLASIKECDQYAIVPYEGCLTIGDVWQGLKEVTAFRVDVREKVMFMGYDISPILRNILLEKIQLHQCLHYWATKNLLKRIQARHFLMTYENYPWERMCVMAAKEVQPAIKVIGYQHTVVPESFLNMFVGEKERRWMPLPDKILTTGDVPRQIMGRFNDPALPMDTSCALRFGHLFDGSDLPPERAKITKVLIALEITFEAFDMVEYMLKELSNSPSTQIRIRTHPALPWDKFEKKFDYHLSQYPNAHVSSNVSLKDDLLWADLIFYSGTTVGVEALAVGKPIIHFDRGTILSFDPLFECPNFKWTVSSSVSLTKVLDEINALSPEAFQEQQLKGREYTRRYFFPVNEDSLRKFRA